MPVDVSPLPLEERAPFESDTFERFNGAIDGYFRALESAEERAEAGSDRPDFEAEIERTQRIIEQQGSAIEEFTEDAEREREKAESLYANYDLVDEVLSTVQEARESGHGWADIGERFAEGAERGIPAAETVVGVDGESGTVTLEVEGKRVELDPAAGVERNADRLYQEAKRTEEKREGAEEAIAETREELEALRERRDAWERGEGGAGEDESEDIGDEREEDVDWLSRSSIPVRRSEQWYERFRWFHTSDGFLVIGGRDADGNEELVKKYLEGPDLFFHAQAHGGPVTVLKATDPGESARDVDIPETSREQAARFAVSYSSVWKDGTFAGDAYEVTPDQVSKTPESGEYLEKGGFAIRGDRTYHRDRAVGVAVGIQCEPETRVVGGPPAAIRPRVETTIELEPGRYAQNDMATMCYREFRERFEDTSFVRKVASADEIQKFLPPGGSRMVEE